MKEKEIISLAKDIRLSALEMAYRSGKNGSHLGGGLSPVEIFACLYGHVLRIDPQDPSNPSRDKLVVSKGHCVLSYYSVLRLMGFLTKEQTDSFETNGSYFHGHAMRNLRNGIEFSGGSLSMGMSFAVGVALADKKRGFDSRTYCIVGDGECDEGMIWEAAMAASNFGLDNFTVIVDRNYLQYDGPTVDVMNTDSLKAKFEAFGFETFEVDGHSVSALLSAFEVPVAKPKCIIANTIKGKGVSFMEGVKEWHHHTLYRDEYDLARKEVEHV